MKTFSPEHHDSTYAQGYSRGVEVTVNLVTHALQQGYDADELALLIEDGGDAALRRLLDIVRETLGEYTN